MFRATVRKWGNSMGVVIPKEQAKKLLEGQEVQVDITAKTPLEELYEADLPPIGKDAFKKFREDFVLSRWE